MADAFEVQLSATPALVNAGATFLLAWSITGGLLPMTASIDQGIGSVPAVNGSQVVTISQATNYTITVTDRGGNVRTSTIAVGVITGNQGTNAVLFSDTFNRANGSPGNGWTDQIGSLWSIASNQLNVAATNQGIGQPFTGDPLTQPLNTDGRDVQVTYTLPANMYSVLASATLAIVRYNANGDLYLIDLEYMSGAALGLSVQKAVATVQTSLGSSTVAINLAHSYRVTAVVFGVNPTYICAKVEDITAGTTPITLSAVVDSQGDLQQNGPFGLGATRSSAATLVFASVSVSALELTCAGEVLSWPSVLGATVYKLYRSTTSGSGYIQVYSGAALTFTDALIARATYYYVLTVSDGVVTSGYSNEVAVVVNYPIQGQITADAQAIVAGQSTTVRWTSTNADAVTINGAGSALSGSMSVSPLTSTTYTESMTAANALTETRSTTVTVSPLPAPSNLTATGRCGSTIALEWQPVALATSYNVLRGTSPGGPYVMIGPTVVPTFLLDTPAGGFPLPWITYYYVVQANMGAATSTNSNEASAYAFDVIGGVAGLFGGAYPGFIALSWMATPHATSYKIYRGTVSGGETLAGVSMNGIFIDNQRGGTFFYKVSAVGPCGEGALSTEIMVVAEEVGECDEIDVADDPDSTVSELGARASTVGEADQPASTSSTLPGRKSTWS